MTTTTAPRIAAKDVPVSRRRARPTARAAEPAGGRGMAGWSFSSVPVSAAVGSVVRSPGRPLEPAARAFFESRLGADFSKVRVHTGREAAASAHALRASAYTVGRDIVFGAGRYEPATSGGRRLLAHELTHVVQQASGRVPASPGVRPADDAFEHEAERVAARVSSGVPSGVPAPTPAAAPPTAPIQRQAEDEEPPEVTRTEEEDRHVPIGATGSPAPEEEEPEEPVQLSREDALPGVIQRQPAPPPPPVVFPHFSEWYGDVADATADAWAFTCKDRKERGFHVLWNEQTKRARADELTVSDKEGAIEIPRPKDRDPVFVVAWFHTHPRPKPGFVQVGVGPSDRDKKTSADSGLPGAVRDFLAPGIKDCKKSGTFFFGPERRAALSR